jgi:acetyltransferase EpsM
MSMSYSEKKGSEPRPLILVGGGEHALVVADAARESGWLLRGYSETAQNPAFEAAVGIPFLGDDATVAREHAADASFIIAVGKQETRARLVASLAVYDLRFATVVHPKAIVAGSAIVAPGATVLAGAVVNPGARVGAHAIVNTAAVIEHDVVVEPLAHVSPAAAVGGGARILDGAVVGLGARVRDHVTVGRNAVVGMGAVVVADVPAGQTVVGVPARARREVREGVA